LGAPLREGQFAPPGFRQQQILQTGPRRRLQPTPSVSRDENSRFFATTGDNLRTFAQSWVKVAARNEAWDLAVYTRALARHETAQFTDATWDRLTAERTGPPDAAQADLAALWAPDLRARAAAIVATPAPPPPPPPLPAPAPWIGRREGGVGRRQGWLR
jgi:hypothetical protein